MSNYDIKIIYTDNLAVGRFEMALDHQDTPDPDEDSTSFMDQHRGKIIQAVIAGTIIAGLGYAFLGPKDDRSNVKNFFSDCKPVNGACK